MLESSPLSPLEKSNRSFSLSKIRPRSDSSELIVKLQERVSRARFSIISWLYVERKYIPKYNKSRSRSDAKGSRLIE